MSQSGENLPVEVESALLAQTPPAELLGALKACGAEARVLAGFRPAAASLKLPPVRERLRHELQTNPEFQSRLLDGWRQAHAALVTALDETPETDVPARLPALAAQWGADAARVALSLDRREPVRTLSVSLDAAPPVSPRTPAFRAPARREDPRLGRLREEVKALKSALVSARRETASLRSQRDTAQRLAEKLKTESEAFRSEAVEQKRVAQRALRQAQRLQKAKAELETRLREALRAEAREKRRAEALRREAEARARGKEEETLAVPSGPEWLQAARELILAGEPRAAALLLSALASKHSAATPLSEALADAYLAAGETGAAVAELLKLARGCLRRKDANQAVAWLARAFSLAPGEPEAAECLREAAALLSPDPARAWQSLQPMVAGHAGKLTLAAMEAALVPASLRGGSGSTVQIDLDEPLDLPDLQGEFRVSLRTVTKAIDANDVELVSRVRESLGLLGKRCPAARLALLESLGRHDDSYRRVLERPTRPIVVDGSNVAWHGQEKGGRAHVAYLRAVRRELHKAGCFPVRVIVDASLFHQIDQPRCLEEMIARGEVIRADAGRDADEQILEEARALRAAVVSNDRMRDHDPDGVVRKLCFEVGQEGAFVHGL